MKETVIHAICLLLISMFPEFIYMKTDFKKRYTSRLLKKTDEKYTRNLNRNEIISVFFSENLLFDRFNFFC